MKTLFALLLQLCQLNIESNPSWALGIHCLNQTSQSEENFSSRPLQFGVSHSKVQILHCKCPLSKAPVEYREDSVEILTSEMTEETMGT